MTAPIQTAITGVETAPPDMPLGALAEFYRAFNGGDLDLMARNWLIDGEIAMDNPLGGIKRGWRAISKVYRRIFSSHVRVTVALTDYTLHESAEIFYAVGREYGDLDATGLHLDLSFRTTRLFRRAGPRWRQVHRHGSIDDPQALREYQAILSQLEGVRARFSRRRL